MSEVVSVVSRLFEDEGVMEVGGVWLSWGVRPTRLEGSIIMCSSASSTRGWREGSQCRRN